MNLKIWLKNRNYSLDLLRVISMFMVVTLHFLTYGGYSGHSNSIVRIEANLLISFAYVCVNCFVFISGYFLCEKSFVLRRVVTTEIQMLFYSVMTFVILLAMNSVEFTYGKALRSVLPFCFENYWFVRNYIVLLLATPFLNAVVKGLDKNKFKIVLFNLIAVFSVYTIFNSYIVPIDSEDGFGYFWFFILYLTAAYLKKHYTPTGKCKKYVIGYIVVALIFFLLCELLKHTSIILLSNDSIFAYIESVFFFLIFLNIKIENVAFGKVIAFIAPLTFAVYMIHHAPYVKELFWKNYINFQTVQVNEFTLIPMALLVILSIFVVCLIIEFIRVKLFALLRLDRLIVFVSDKIEFFIRKMIDK